MTYKILCVDDDVNILQGYKRALRRDFDIYTAEGGIEALRLIDREGPFAVIVSDMRMPVMDGVQFLRRSQEAAPDSVRIMLTGNADQQTAVDAVNDGKIFRFLNKPCPPEDLALALTAGIEQYRLITAEKELLELTLNQSLQVLVDILAMVNPTAFNRSNRVKKLARQLAEMLGVRPAWEIEFAALLSQVGCVTVPEEILQKISRGEALSEHETTLYHAHPQVGRDLIAKIPRMETVAEIIANQNKRAMDDITSNLPPYKRETLVIGARIVRVVFDYDKLVQAGHLPLSAFHELAEREGWYDPRVITAFKAVLDKQIDEFVTKDVFVVDLRPGMILNKALYSTRETLLLSAGQEITMSLILRLTNFAEAGFIEKKVSVSVPVALLEEELLAV